MSTVLKLLALLLLLSGCVSTYAKSYVGKSAFHLKENEGFADNVISLPDGRKIHQYYWGGGEVYLPEESVSNTIGFGSSSYTTTYTYPAETYASEGCLVNFIAEEIDGRWMIVEATWPDRLVC